MSEQVYRNSGLAMPLLVAIIMGAIGVFIFFHFGG
jgi:cell division protein FtsL